jgi:hypothetical protein
MNFEDCYFLGPRVSRFCEKQPPFPSILGLYFSSVNPKLAESWHEHLRLNYGPMTNTGKMTNTPSLMKNKYQGDKCSPKVGMGEKVFEKG